MGYNFKEIEKKWQDKWYSEGTFYAKENSNQKKWYGLIEFPYPSGQGLHVGHPRSYTALDIIARKKRMDGYNVLYPIGFDAFGLPAENYAIKNHVHPKITTEKNINHFREQLKALGFSFDWSREVDTTDPNYYKWTQWIFKQLFEDGLAKLIDMPVNWCEELGTVLANDEVINGKSERGGFPVVRKNMKQWVLDIPKYAETLLEGLENLDWPESTKEIQRNWIGKSEGAEVKFKVADFENIDFTVVNAENVAGGMGISTKIFNELCKLKIDVLTMGNHTWGKKDIFSFITNPKLIRPANYSKGVPRAWIHNN